MFWVTTLIQKWQPRVLDVKNKKGKESQNNEIEITPEIKEGKKFFFFLCCNTIFPVVT